MDEEKTVAGEWRKAWVANQWEPYWHEFSEEERRQKKQKVYGLGVICHLIGWLVGLIDIPETGFDPKQDDEFLKHQETVHFFRYLRLFVWLMLLSPWLWNELGMPFCTWLDKVLGH